MYVCLFVFVGGPVLRPERLLLAVEGVQSAGLLGLPQGGALPPGADRGHRLPPGRLHSPVHLRRPQVQQQLLQDFPGTTLLYR